MPYLVWAALAGLVGQEWVSVKLTVLTQAVAVAADRLAGLAAQAAVALGHRTVPMLGYRTLVVAEAATVVTLAV